jgi:hypothetical protein
MGLQIRDERQMKALTGLSQAQFDSLLPVFSDIYRVTQQQTYEEGIQSGTRRRHPRVFCPAPRICSAPHIRGYVESMNMRSILPLDGSNSFNIK